MGPVTLICLSNTIPCPSITSISNQILTSTSNFTLNSPLLPRKYMIEGYIIRHQVIPHNEWWGDGVAAQRMLFQEIRQKGETRGIGRLATRIPLHRKIPRRIIQTILQKDTSKERSPLRICTYNTISFLIFSCCRTISRLSAVGDESPPAIPPHPIPPQKRKAKRRGINDASSLITTSFPIAPKLSFSAD